MPSDSGSTFPLGDSGGERFNLLMIKRDIVECLARDFPNLGPARSRLALDAILSQIEAALADGRRVELRGFGTFVKRVSAPSPRRNPKTGEQLDPTVRVGTVFRAGKSLNERINRPKR